MERHPNWNLMRPVYINYNVSSQLAHGKRLTLTMNKWKIRKGAFTGITIMHLSLTIPNWILLPEWPPPAIFAVALMQGVIVTLSYIWSMGSFMEFTPYSIVEDRSNHNSPSYSSIPAGTEFHSALTVIPKASNKWWRDLISSFMSDTIFLVDLPNLQGKQLHIQWPNSFQDHTLSWSGIAALSFGISTLWENLLGSLVTK